MLRRPAFNTGSYHRAPDLAAQRSDFGREWHIVCRGIDTSDRQCDPRAVLDPRNWLRTENQVSTNSCGGQSLSTAGELVYWLKTGQVIQLSRWFGYIEGQRLAGRLSPRNGLAIVHGVKVFKNLGLPLEELCPFTGRWYTDISKEAYEDALNRQLLQSYVLDTSQKGTDFLMANAGAIYFGMPWVNSFRAAQEIITEVRGSTRVGWHALAFVGWIEVDGEPLYILANSHGKGWGNKGFSLCTPEVMRELWQIGGPFVGLSDMETPQLREFDWEHNLLP